MKQKGFTIIELLVVISIMILFVTLSVMSFTQTGAQSRDRVRIANIQEIRLAVEEYRQMCGEYPAGLTADTNNGDCPSGFSLGEVLPSIPENPEYSEDPGFYADQIYNVLGTYNGYMYAGLTTRTGGPCFEYHVGVPLESGRNDSGGYYNTEYLGEDHDCSDVSLSSSRYTRICSQSEDDFDGSEDATHGVYDMRSANNCS